MFPIVAIFGGLVLTTGLVAFINHMLEYGTEDEINQHFKQKAKNRPQYFAQVEAAIQAGSFSSERAAYLRKKLDEFYARHS